MKFSLLFSLLPTCREITHRLFGRPASGGGSDYTEYTFQKAGEGSSTVKEMEGDLDGNSLQSSNEVYTAAAQQGEIVLPGGSILSRRC